MAQEPRNLLYIGLGLVDYLRDKAEELHEELLRRGDDRSEEIREFLDDIIENIPVLRGGASVEETAAFEEKDEIKEDGPEELLRELDIKGKANEVLKRLGLATGDDIQGLKDRLERLGRAVKVLES